MSDVQKRGPVPMLPLVAGAKLVLSDCDDRVGDWLHVESATDDVAKRIVVAVRGKKGGKKASVWLSQNDARRLAAFLLTQAGGA